MNMILLLHGFNIVDTITSGGESIMNIELKENEIQTIAEALSRMTAWSQAFLHQEDIDSICKEAERLNAIPANHLKLADIDRKHELNIKLLNFETYRALVLKLMPIATKFEKILGDSRNVETELP